jgi:hypothetical protein
VAQQPVAVSMYAQWPAFQTYQSGVIGAAVCKGQQVDHGVLIVGYGTDRGVDYWKVKNSWGTSWGEEGYFRIQAGVDACSIESDPMYPIGVRPVSFFPMPPSPPSPPAPEPDNNILHRFTHDFQQGWDWLNQHLGTSSLDKPVQGLIGGVFLAVFIISAISILRSICRCLFCPKSRREPDPRRQSRRAARELANPASVQHSHPLLHHQHVPQAAGVPVRGDAVVASVVTVGLPID